MNHILARDLCLGITTYGSLPYVHLHLETRRILYPDIPVVVIDDNSPYKNDLNSLCREYGVDFISHKERNGHLFGDLKSFLLIAEWAESMGARVMVKHSRRFLPIRDWTSSLQLLSLQSRKDTFSSTCTDLNLGFRSECVAMNVSSWRRYGGWEPLNIIIEEKEIMWAENLLHYCSDYVYKNKSAEKLGIEEASFDKWEFMGNSRLKQNSNYIWHESNPISAYLDRAVYLGMNYKEIDFIAD